MALVLEPKIGLSILLILLISLKDNMLQRLEANCKACLQSI